MAARCSAGSHLYCCTELRETLSQKHPEFFVQMWSMGKRRDFVRFRGCTYSAACWDGVVKIGQLGDGSSGGWGEHYFTIPPDGP